MTPLRRTGIQRRTELARTPLRRKKASAAVAAAKRTVSKQRTQAAVRRRDTGPDPETKALLWQRAKGRCEICGHDVNGAPFSRHHRSPRRMGGSTVAWINDITNLLLLCGTGTTGCHGAVESNRSRPSRPAGSSPWATTLLRSRS